MRNLLKGLLLLGIIVAVASCTPPEPALENQIRINGTVYPITNAAIYYWDTTSRGVALYFDDGSGTTYLGTTFADQDSQVPSGTWTAFDATLPEIFIYYSSVYHEFDSTTGSTIDVIVTGTDGDADGIGGTLSIDGNVSDDTNPTIDCAFNYSGPYAYMPD